MFFLQTVWFSSTLKCSDMEPFTMMLGYGLINSVSQLVIRPLTDRLGASSRREEMLSQMEQKHKLDLESVRLNKEIDFSYNQQIQEFCHQCRLKEARHQFEKQLEMWTLGQFNASMWPLLTPFDHPSLKPNYAPNQHVPVNVFLAKTDPRSPYAMLIQSDVKNRLSNFITTTYSNSVEHPAICRIGDWKDGFQDAAFINALWYGMQGQPSIVINPIQSELGELLDLNVSMWGLASNGYAPVTQTALSGAFGSAIGRIKREETRKWVDSGLLLSSPEMKHNAELLKQEGDMIANGRADLTDRLLVQYKLPKEIQTAVITRFSREYSHIISCVTGMYSDIYHLIEYGSKPYMPKAIEEYNKSNGVSFDIPEIAAKQYRKALTNLACSNYLQDKLPLAYLGVASSLSYDPVQQCPVQPEWELVKMTMFNIQVFENWVLKYKLEALKNGATEAVAYITSENNVMLCFVSNEAENIPVCNIAGGCVMADSFDIASTFMDGAFIEYDLVSNRYISNQRRFMQKKEFDSFQRIGKQLDMFVNNLKKTSRAERSQGRDFSSLSYEETPTNGFEKQLIDFFVSCNMISLESEVCDVAKFESIHSWIVSKLPVQRATQAHIFRFHHGRDLFICIFFSNGEEAFLEEQFPKKRILCGSGDNELNAFFGECSIVTIKL